MCEDCQPSKIQPIVLTAKEKREHIMTQSEVNVYWPIQHKKKVITTTYVNKHLASDQISVIARGQSNKIAATQTID